MLCAKRLSISLGAQGYKARKKRSLFRIYRSEHRETYFQIGLPVPGSPSFDHLRVTASMTSSSMRISWPHSRFVSGGHLLVASSAILPPSPLSGEAKSR